MEDRTESSSAPFRRVLFFNAAKAGARGSRRLHLGLLSLAAVLTKAGHTVQVIDYSYLLSLPDENEIPSVSEAVNAFRPDVIGLSVFSFLYDEAEQMLAQIHACSDAPVIVGGPHVTLFPDDFRDDPRVHCVVRGESEAIIDRLICSLSPGAPRQVIDAPLPELKQLPRPMLGLARGAEHLSEYQIQLSRGCPYQCTFCTVQKLAGNRIRARSIDVCLAELVEAKKARPSLRRIIVTDDCPTYDMARFKDFLRQLAHLRLGCELWTDNMRANLIDDELLRLYKEAGGTNICIGVESGSPAVFESICKAETLSDMHEAAHLIHRHDLKLGLCFVIGLPGDNLIHHRQSMRLARELAPDYIFWNMCVAWPGTLVHEWFVAHGAVGEFRNFSTLMSQHGDFQTPPCTSPDFTAQQRITAWLSANLETHYYFTSLRDLVRLAHLAAKYRCVKSFCIYCLRYAWRSVLRACWRTLLHPRTVLRRRGS